MAPRLSQNAFVGGILSPALLARSDLDKYGFCVRRAKNAFVHRWGGISNRAGTIFVGEVTNSAKRHKLLDFTFSTTQAYALDFGDANMRVIMNRGYVLEATKAITGITQASPGVVTAVGHGYSVGDQVRPASIAGMTQLNGKNYLVNTTPTADTLTLKDMYGTVINTTAFSAYTSGGTLARVYSITLPYADTEVFDIGFAQSPDILYACHLSYAVRKITRTGHANWSINSVTFGPTVLAPTSPTATPTLAGATTYSYQVTSINDANGEESLPTGTFTCTNDLTIATHINTLAWSAATDATRYIIYKEDNGVFGFIGGTVGLSFVDDNIVADLGDTPPQARNPFNASGDYPRRATFHEQRLTLASTTNDPEMLVFSQTAKYENLNVSVPAKADDAITIRLSPGVAAITGLVSQKDGLVTFTNEREFLITGSGVTDYLTPASNFARKQTKRGAADTPPPIEIGDITLYVQRQGAVVRAFGYVFEKDGYRGNDLTLLAPHLFRGRTIIDWCYAQDPHSIVWVVLDNGVLLSLTFVDEQNVFAWTEHRIGGSFGSLAYGVVESCCSIEGADEDEVYLVVKRTINGQTKKYVEVIAPRWIPTFDDDDDPNTVNNIDEAYFLDCGLSYSGTATTSFSGLDHLEGQTVSALADGDVVSGLTVSGGAVTLPNAASVVSIGLPYTSEIQTLPISQQTPEGAPQGKFKVVVDIVLKVECTRGISVGPDTDRLESNIITRASENWSDPMLPYTGDVGPKSMRNKWNKDGSIVIRQSFPLPMTLLGAYPSIDIGGS